MIEPEYLHNRKKFIKTIWYSTYFYNIIMAIFFYHPEIVNMNFDNIDNRILTVCRTFCLFDIILTPLFIKLINCFTYDLFRDLKYTIFNSLDEIQKFKDQAEAKRKIEKLQKDTQRMTAGHGILGQGIGNAINVFGILAIGSEMEDKKKRRIRERELKLEIKKKNYRYNHLKFTLSFLPHGSFQWYSLITSIYSTIVLVLDFTTEGYILWGIYFSLLILNILSLQYSVYLDFFKTSKFITLLIQLFDLGTNFAFLYEIGGFNSQSIDLYGETLLSFYLISFLISYFSLLFLYYYDFMEKRIPQNGKQENKDLVDLYQKKQLYANTSLGVLGNIPLSIFTVIIGNIESGNDNSITVLSVVTSLFTFILSISELIESRQINYTYEKTYNSRTSEI